MEDYRMYFATEPGFISLEFCGEPYQRMVISPWMFQTAGGKVIDPVVGEPVYGRSSMRATYDQWVRIKNIRKEVIKPGMSYYFPELAKVGDTIRVFGTNLNKTCLNHWTGGLSGICPDCRQP